MADDGDLNEDEFKLPTTERLKQSKKKRAQQLKKYSQFEKQLEKEGGKKSKKVVVEKTTQKKDKRVQFPGSITLLEASARDDKDEVRRLLRMGISADVCNDDGLTALHQCCIDDAGDMMSVLLEFGANVNATDCELWTPLHAAATCGRIRLCQVLVDHGADLLAVNGDGNMPYDICDHDATLDYIEYEMAKKGITQELIDDTRLVREKKMLDDLKELHNQNGDLEFRGKNGETPLHIAAANGYEDVAKFLLTHRARVDSVDNELWQPIHCAACWGQLCVLELLLEHGANLEAKTGTGATALDICEDVEMRHRILEIKQEVENSRIAKSRELSRRHSSTIRRSRVSRGNSLVRYSSVVAVEKNPLSASVRRTSMREKNEMSWKEAKEEARRMRETTSEMLKDMDDDDTRKENGPASPADNNRLSTTGAAGNLLSPLISVEETLDVRFDSSKKSTNERSSLRQISKPESPEALVSRGLNLDGSLPIVDSESTERKTNGGLPVSTASGAVRRSPSPVPETLPELKKQRASGRHPEARGSDVNLELAGNAEKNEDVTFKTPRGDVTSFQTPTKTSTRRVDIRKCCVII